MKDRIALLRNVAMLSAASYVEMAFGLALGVVIARSLGSSEFGHYAFAVWACGMLLSLSNNALTMSSIRFIAEARGTSEPEAAASLQGHLSLWHVISTATVLSTFAAIALIWPPDEWKDAIWQMVPLIVVGAWSRSGYAMMASIAKGHERFDIEGLPLAVSAAINLVLVLLLSYSGGSLIGFFGIYAICGLIQNLMARITLRRMNIKPVRKPLSAELGKRLKGHLLQTGVLVTFAILGDRVLEVLLLKTFSTAEAVGFFAIAGALTKGATYLLAGALSSVLLPTMSKAVGSGGQRAVTRMLQESIRFYWFIGIAIAGMGCAMAPGVVRFFYGAQYEGAITAVVVNLTIAGFVLVYAAFNAYQTASDRQGDRIRITLWTLGVNAIAAFALVPAFGLMGALGSLAITRLAAVCISWSYVRRAENASMPLLAMSKILGAGLVAISLADLAEQLVEARFAFIIGGLVFVTVYFAVSVVLKAWTSADYELLAALANGFGKAGGRVGARIESIGARFAAPLAVEYYGKREVMSRVFTFLGISQLVGAVRAHFVRELKVLAYHRVVADFDETTYAFDKELISARSKDFDWQMAYLAKRFKPVSCQEVADAIDSGRPLPKRAVMVTFDDGFLDNYEVAFPILRKHGIPAVFFITTGYMDGQRVFWFDWLVHVLLTTKERTIRIDALGHTIELKPSPETRRAEAAILLRLLKKTSECTRLEVLEQLRVLSGVTLSPAHLADSAVMTWEQVRVMSSAGMEFGSHTVTHPILSMMSDREMLRQELSASKATIELETGLPVIALSYPVGGRGAINEEVLEETVGAGYRIAFTYQSGQNMVSQRNRFLLKRIHIERYTSHSMFKSALQIPGVFGT